MTTIKKITIILITLTLVIGVIGCQNPITEDETTNSNEPTYITYKFNSNYWSNESTISWKINGVEEEFKIYNDSEVAKEVLSTDTITDITIVSNNAGFELKNLGNNEYLVDFTTELVTITNNNSSSYTYPNNNNLNIFDSDGKFVTSSTFTIESGENTIRVESSELSLFTVDRYDLGMELTHYNIEKLSDTSYNIYEFTDFIKLVVTNMDGTAGDTATVQVDSGSIDYYYKNYLDYEGGVPGNHSFTVDENTKELGDTFLTEENINNNKINITNNEYLRYTFSHFGNIDKVTANIQIYYMDRLWKEIPKGSDYDSSDENMGVIYFQDILEGSPYLIE